MGINVSSQVVAARIANIDAERLRRRAQERGEGVSPYLAELIRRDLNGQGAPDGLESRRLGLRQPS
jgi:hypothetical protein